MGPAVESPEKVRELIAAGMNMARLNLSHGSYEEHQARLDMVRAAAKEHEGNLCLGRKANGLDQFIGRPGFEQPLSRSTDAKRRERTEWRFDRHALDTECVLQPSGEGVHAPLDSSASKGLSRRSKAVTASERLHAWNWRKSPGATWPATPMSALITVAIFA